ncbi:MAG: autotransporter strand-loop-strand O-heptosyltransferase [Victivallaceae bacterium]|nr:autotransporter strand-loop-strand O-heptosyltransferase [Victivallaceae bacterium]
MHAAPVSVRAGRRPVPPPVPPEVGPDPRAKGAVLEFTRPTVELGKGVAIDFCSGVRIAVPSGITVRVRVVDLDGGAVLEESVCPGGRTYSSRRKYFIRARVEVFDVATGAMIGRHDYDCTDRDVAIVIPDGGLGDNLAWLPLAEEFRSKHNCKLTCICGEWLIRLVGEHYPDIKFVAHGSVPVLSSYACYYLAIFGEDRMDWRPSEHQRWGMQGSVAMILGLEPGPRKMRLRLDSPRPFPEPFVAISTMATNPCKYWNFPDGWNEIVIRLRACGYRVLDIDRDHDLYFTDRHVAIPREAEDFTGFIPIAKRIDMLRHADFFIGLPSGLSWLAWNCNIPVVLISGFTMEGSEFPTPYRVTNYKTCHGCWNDSRLFFDPAAPCWCPRHLGTRRELECTRSITPDMVWNAICRIPAFVEHNKGRMMK